MGEGTLWVALLLSRVNALVACDESRIVNRYVRPLLRALTKQGALAHFFGRDWISVKHRPAAWTGFAHDRASGRTVFEAFVACDTPFDVGPRASFLGKEPGTLASIVGGPVDLTRLADAIVASYADAYGRAAIDRGEVPTDGPMSEDARVTRRGLPRSTRSSASWARVATREAGSAWGATCSPRATPSGRSRRRSKDQRGTSRRSFDAALAAPHVALDGVRSLESIARVILAARAQNLA